MKKIFIASILMIAGIYLIYNALFPLAKPIKYPQIKEVENVIVWESDGVETDLKDTDYASIYQYICGAKPTRKKSVNDCPSVEKFHSMTVKTDKESYDYMIYEEDGKVYIEIPYVGIYNTDYEILEVIDRGNL